MDGQRSTCTSTGIDYIWNYTQETTNEDWDVELEFESEGNLLFIIYPVIIHFFFFLPFVKITFQLKRNLAKEKIAMTLSVSYLLPPSLPQSSTPSSSSMTSSPRCPKARGSFLQTWSIRYLILGGLARRPRVLRNFRLRQWQNVEVGSEKEGK